MSHGLRSASVFSWHLLEGETAREKADWAVNGALAKKIFFLTTKLVPIGSSKLLHAPFLIGNSRAQ